VRVELDIYSGRPNPAWDTSPAQTAAIKAALMRLPATTVAVQEPAVGLGYRGFRLTDPDRDWRLRVYHSTVVEKDGAHTIIRCDPDATLERTLAALASTHLDASTREFLTNLNDYPAPGNGY
jgi:hypothetical protein